MLWVPLIPGGYFYQLCTTSDSSFSELKKCANCFGLHDFIWAICCCLNCFSTIGSTSFLSGCFPQFSQVFNFLKFNCRSLEINLFGFIWFEVWSTSWIYRFLLEIFGHYVFEYSFPTTFYLFSWNSDEYWIFFIAP